MAEINHAVKGTLDVLPFESYKWQFLEKTMLKTAHLFGYREIRVPVFEHTEVFSRSVGDTTDVVQKEMYTFLDKSGRSLTLRPELTAGTIRSVIEKGLTAGTLPVKACYIGGCYRYEKPQAGRLREFHQFGVECVGAAEPSADAEVIALAHEVLKAIGLKNLSLQINSIGCPTCRAEYHKALKAYFESRKGDLCETCLERLDRNPMRILDCKSPSCQEIAANAPVMLDFLCDDCRSHFEKVKELLTASGIAFTVNPTIVRGLDYYTRTVFEFVSQDIGAQSTVCGGGRYDGLIAQMGGQPTPSLGFAMGLERLLLALERNGAVLPDPEPTDLYLAVLGDRAKIASATLTAELRSAGFSAETDLCGRGLKAQMRYANKIGAAFSMVLGDEELNRGRARLKNMKTGEEREVLLADLCNELGEAGREQALDELTDTICK